MLARHCGGSWQARDRTTLYPPAPLITIAALFQDTWIDWVDAETGRPR